MEPVTYKQNISKNELLKLMKAVGLPIAILFFTLLTISAWGEFGFFFFTKMIGLMWIVGVGTATYLSQMREEVLDQTCAFIFFYDAAMLGFKLLISITSGVSGEMISAAMQIASPQPTQNVISGYIPIMMQMSAIMTPIGFIAMQGKRIMQFRKTRSINKEFGRVRGIRNSGRTHDEIM